MDHRPSTDGDFRPWTRPDGTATMAGHLQGAGERRCRRAHEEAPLVVTPTSSSPPGSGHRLDEHDGDVAIEAWGPDDATCLAEAMAGLVGSFARIEGAAPDVSRPLRTGETAPEDALVALLEDVLYRLEVDREVPVHIRLAASERGGYEGEADVVAADDLEPAGPVPKAVTYHELTMARDEGGWRCHVVVDL